MFGAVMLGPLIIGRPPQFVVQFVVLVLVLLVVLVIKLHAEEVVVIQVPLQFETLALV